MTVPLIIHSPFFTLVTVDALIAVSKISFPFLVPFPTVALYRAPSSLSPSLIPFSSHFPRTHKQVSIPLHPSPASTSALASAPASVAYQLPWPSFLHFHYPPSSSLSSPSLSIPPGRNRTSE
ncbi:hypothetical protein Dimus_037266 [Dionaea muscipula]